MDYLINGRGAFVGIAKQDRSLVIDLVWLDKWCPATVDLSGFGVVEIPPEIQRLNSTILLQDLVLPLHEKTDP